MRQINEHMIGWFACIYSFMHTYEYVYMSLYACGLVKFGVSVELRA